MRLLSNICYYLGALSIPLSIFAWFTVQNDDKHSGEDWGIFIGLWSPTFLICGKVLEDRANLEDKKVG